MTRAATFLLLFVFIAILASPALAVPSRNSKSPQATSAYWTKERMQNAKPRDRARPGGGGGVTKTSDWSRYTVPLLNGAYEVPNNRNGKVFFTLGGTN